MQVQVSLQNQTNDFSHNERTHTPILAIFASQHVTRNFFSHCRLQLTRMQLTSGATRTGTTAHRRSFAGELCHLFLYRRDARVTKMNSATAIPVTSEMAVRWGEGAGSTNEGEAEAEAQSDNPPPQPIARIIDLVPAPFSLLRLRR